MLFNALATERSINKDDAIRCPGNEIATRNLYPEISNPLCFFLSIRYCLFFSTFQMYISFPVNEKIFRLCIWDVTCRSHYCHSLVSLHLEPGPAIVNAVPHMLQIFMHNLK